MDSANNAARRTFLDMNGYQWTVILAAWLGWGFDIFDSILMNYVAPNAVPTLLGLQIGTPEATVCHALVDRNPDLTSACGLGRRRNHIRKKLPTAIGRTKTLLITMLSTRSGPRRAPSRQTFGCSWSAELSQVSASAASGRQAPQWSPRSFRKSVESKPVHFCIPQRRSVYSSRLSLLTRSPAFTLPIRQLRGGTCSLFGLAPAAVAFFVRLFIKEPERWKKVGSEHRAKISELFSPKYRKLTISGFLMAVTALITLVERQRLSSRSSQRASLRANGPNSTNAGVAGLPTIEVMGQQWIRTATTHSISAVDRNAS
jgi:hypothetical protein